MPASRRPAPAAPAAPTIDPLHPTGIGSFAGAADRRRTVALGQKVAPGAPEPEPVAPPTPKVEPAPTGLRYCLHSAWIRSVRTGERIEVSEGELAARYGLHLDDPDVVVGQFGERRLPNDVHLYPRAVGAYVPVR